MNRIILLLLLISLVSSCRTQKDIWYFQNIDQVINETAEIYEDPKIQTGDALSIVVSTFNPKLAEPFNLGGGVNNTRSISEDSPAAYVVSSDGNIEMPMLGSIQAAGKTRQELAILLEEKIKTYVNDPIVNVRYINFRVSMLGEFNRPGVVESKSEKLSIMEAIAKSGDMSLYAIRDSVMIIRTTDGIREHKFVNLLDANLINSEYYYLRQNDILYAMPTKSKAIEFNSRPIRDGLTVLGFVLTIYALFK
ncbi:polysaccharide biosynthesis/export family protein [Weeksellaceae bacterium KMM 9724]|uniref:polysaccharide biosynthesis/export family protein n=1 Tax=Profundicola chukchiensis TaxID=2961959 RepID=UPI00243C96EF|nr:polysaccharide biosynthesis/export family protein [Profundicola chukchiensis]MDG4949862.1 polysaccharide biosynthesis/export family protein [Profundicola chukchiensis]